MRAPLLRRLDLLEAARESELALALARSRAGLAEAARGAAVLAAYRARLAAGWRAGAVADVAAAQRAERFATASRAAGGQLDQAMREGEAAAQATEAALAASARRRRLLGEKLGAALQAEAATAAAKAARDRPPRTAKTAGIASERSISWT